MHFKRLLLLLTFYQISRLKSRKNLYKKPNLIFITQLIYAGTNCRTHWYVLFLPFQSFLRGSCHIRWGTEPERDKGSINTLWTKNGYVITSVWEILVCAVLMSINKHNLHMDDVTHEVVCIMATPDVSLTGYWPNEQ